MENRRIGLGDADIIRYGDYGIEISAAIYNLGILLALLLPFFMLWHLAWVKKQILKFYIKFSI